MNESRKELLQFYGMASSENGQRRELKRFLVFGLEGDFYSSYLDAKKNECSRSTRTFPPSRTPLKRYSTSTLRSFTRLAGKIAFISSVS